MLPRRRDAQAGAHFHWHGPEQRASFRIERIDRFRVPNDELFSAGSFDHGWRTIARFLRRQRAPYFFAGHFVEGYRNAPLSSHEADQFVPVDQRMRRKSPQRGARAEILFEIARPKNFS